MDLYKFRDNLKAEYSRFYKRSTTDLYGSNDKTGQVRFDVDTFRWPDGFAPLYPNIGAAPKLKRLSISTEKLLEQLEGDIRYKPLHDFVKSAAPKSRFALDLIEPFLHSALRCSSIGLAASDSVITLGVTKRAVTVRLVAGDYYAMLVIPADNTLSEPISYDMTKQIMGAAIGLRFHDLGEWDSHYGRSKKRKRSLMELQHDLQHLKAEIREVLQDQPKWLRDMVSENDYYYD
ncbi:MAG: hypothetical protein CTR53_10305 [Ferrovibrio sp.]|nr:MAG: hypothetical protein CTR53_10305 [Ferrovibrio sp.]